MRLKDKSYREIEYIESMIELERDMMGRNRQPSPATFDIRLSGNGLSPISHQNLEFKKQ